MLVKEYRIVMPFRLDEYYVGSLYTIAKASLEETGGGEGVQMIKNEPFDGLSLFHGKFTKGQYTKKIHKVESKVSWFVRKVAPKEWMMAVEESWNAYPYYKTELTNENIGPGNRITIETMHLADRGTTENALELPPAILEQREVIFIDIAAEAVSKKDYKESTDPTKIKLKKAQRGPLQNGWWKTHDPILCSYKVVTVEFNRWTLIKGRIENYFASEYRRIFQRYHRQVFCWGDQWFGLTLAEVRKVEEETRKALEEEVKSNVKRGQVPDDN